MGIKRECNPVFIDPRKKAKLKAIAGKAWKPGAIQKQLSKLTQTKSLSCKKIDYETCAMSDIAVVMAVSRIKDLQPLAA